MAEWNILSSQRAQLHDHRVASGTSNGLFCGRMWSVHDSSCPVAGAFERTEVLADNVPGQTAISRRDLAKLVQAHVERVDGVHSTRVRVRRTRVNVTVFSVLDDLEPVRQAAQKAAEQAIQTLKPVETAHSRVRIQHTS